MRNYNTLQIKLNTEDNTNSKANHRAALSVALTAGIAGMGDAFLYVYLPVEGQNLGLSLTSIGLILSINRFSRLFTNAWVAWFGKHFGLKVIVLSAIIITAFTTFLYGQQLHLAYWLVIRILWGIAFASFRLTYMRYAHLSKNAPSTMGFTRSLQEIGPLAVYWSGPAILNLLGTQTLFALLASLTVLLLPCLLFIRNDQSREQSVSLFKFSKPKLLDYWSFLLAFLESSLVVGLSLIIDFSNSSLFSALGGVAFYIALKRLINISISPLTGTLSGYLGLKKLFSLSCIAILLAALLVSLQIPTWGVILAFVAISLNIVCLPLFALENTDSKGVYRTLTNVNTSRDLGSSFGALLVLPLLSALSTSVFFSIILVIIGLVYYRMNQSLILRQLP